MDKEYEVTATFTVRAKSSDEARELFEKNIRCEVATMITIDLIFPSDIPTENN